MVCADKEPSSAVVHVIILNWRAEVSEIHFTLKVLVSLSLLESGAASLDQPRDLHILGYGSLNPLVSLPALLE